MGRGNAAGPEDEGGEYAEEESGELVRSTAELRDHGLSAHHGLALYNERLNALG
jgi:hypothetical protein